MFERELLILTTLCFDIFVVAPYHYLLTLGYEMVEKYPDCPRGA